MSGCNFISYKFVLFFLCAFIWTIGAQPLAQDSIDALLGKPKKVEKKAAPSNDLSDIPDAYFAEAKAYNDQCRGTPHLNNYYDCDCMAARLLDQRIQRGPDVNQSSILLKLGGKCKNAANMAGSEYSKCMTSYFNLPKNIPAEEYCSCFANTYAKIFELSNAKPSAKLSMAIHKRASLSCKNPELAKRLYPEISGIHKKKN